MDFNKQSFHLKILLVLGVFFKCWFRLLKICLCIGQVLLGLALEFRLLLLCLASVREDGFQREVGDEKQQQDEQPQIITTDSQQPQQEKKKKKTLPQTTSLAAVFWFLRLVITSWCDVFFSASAFSKAAFSSTNFALSLSNMSTTTFDWKS